MALPSEPHTYLHNAAFLIPRDSSTYTPTSTAHAPNVTHALPEGIEAAVDAFVNGTASNSTVFNINGTVSDETTADLSLPGFSAMCMHGNTSSSM